MAYFGGIFFSNMGGGGGQNYFHSGFCGFKSTFPAFQLGVYPCWLAFLSVGGGMMRCLSCGHAPSCRGARAELSRAWQTSISGF